MNAETQAVRAVLQDLSTYQFWLDLVDHVEPSEPADADPGPAYLVTLIAKIGPFARRKRLRMVRQEINESGATFQRREVDRREHSEWVLGAHAEPGEPTTVSMRLAYGGGLWSEVLERVLEDQIRDAVDSLALHVRRLA